MMTPVESFLDFAKTHVPFHRRRAPAQHLVLSNWPLMAKADLEAYRIGTSTDLLSSGQAVGYILASGGTTAKPVYVLYSHDEMAVMAQNLCHHFRLNGMEPGDKVVNYFGAGDMCGGFLLADKILEALPITILPLAYTQRMDYSLEILDHFRPDAIMGSLSAMTGLALRGAEQGRQIRISKVFSGGEPVTPGAMNLLQSTWNCELIRSAGYATTEVGSIGWQCPYCEIGEHHAFKDTIVEIIDGEIVVTSLRRRAMPMIRYRTGDQGRWENTACRCGDEEPTFTLLGRCDNALLVWGVWVLFSDLVGTLHDLNISFTAIQAHIHAEGHQQLLTVKVESPAPPRASQPLRCALYERARDISAVLPREALDQSLFFDFVPVGSLPRDSRTGKVIPVIDTRF
jgi:phenylacetate-coenzyme A ligase PaaK-like adenylate-forming protein